MKANVYEKKAHIGECELCFGGNLELDNVLIDGALYHVCEECIAGFDNKESAYDYDDNLDRDDDYGCNSNMEFGGDDYDYD